MSVRTAGFPTDGLVAAYLMNGTARDSSGRGHHASTSRVTKTPNRFDTPRKALYFDGVDSVLTIPNHRDFSVNTTGYLSISVWVRPEGTTLNPDGELLFADTQGSGYVHWFGKGDASGEHGNREWSFRVYSADNAETPNRHNRMSFYHFSFDGGLGPGCYVEDPLVSGEWMHYVAVSASRTTGSGGTRTASCATLMDSGRLTVIRSRMPISEMAAHPSEWVRRTAAASSRAQSTTPTSTTEC
jgi:hypothetical protein